MLSPTPTAPRSAVSVARWLAVALAVGTIVRLAYAVDAAGIFHPDEIFQSLEPAHGVVFGVGFRTWEFVAGARPWTTAGVYVLLLGVLKALGLTTSAGYLLVVRLFDALIASTWPWLCFRIGRALRSPRAGVLAATFAATWYLLVLLAPRALNHTFSVSFGLWAIARLLERKPEGPRWATYLDGLLFGLAAAFRYQDALVALGAAIFLASERRSRALPLLFAGGATVLLAVGLLDWLTWGAPFHSLLAYVDANLVQNAASRFGAMPVWFYGWYIPATFGLGTLAFLLLPMAGRRALRLLLAIGVLMLVAHSLTDNKQVRFVLPALLLLLCALGCAADALIDRVASHGPRAATIATTLLVTFWITASAGRATDLTFATLGMFAGQPEAQASPWSFRRDLDRALERLGREVNLCGLVIYPYGGAAGSARLVTTGGYTHLNRAVPMTMGPLAPQARSFTSHALLCEDADGRRLSLPGFVDIARIGTCTVARNLESRCDADAAARQLVAVRWSSRSERSP
jgi:phosphatidylinositol glycan class B